MAQQYHLLTPLSLPSFQFQTAATDIVDVTMERVRRFSSTIHSASLKMTSAAAGSGIQWPFYTFDNLEVATQHFLDYSPSVQLIYAPLVSDSNRAEWEAYSVQHQNRVIQPTYPYTIPEFVHSRYNGTIELIPDENDTGPYSPIWQLLPLPDDIDTISYVNFNVLGEPDLAMPMHVARASKRSVLTDLPHKRSMFCIEPTKTDTSGKLRPQSLLLEQVMDGFGSNASAVVGHLFATAPWDLYLENGAPEGGDVRVYCVIQNSCSSYAYTYIVDGVGVEYIGSGDLHEPNSERLKHRAALSSYRYADENDASQDWSCVLEMTIYPTGEMQWAYDSATPVYLLLLILFAFAMVAIAVLTHHRKAETQRREMFFKTQRSKAIIASLFPDTVREKLFDIDGDVKVDNRGFLNKDAARAVALGGEGHQLDDIFGSDNPLSTTKQRQVSADLYLNCTACITDICGFTAWSSSRTPQEVFTLLETIFRGFDKICKERGVFKVETQGDSFVCVSGLPGKSKSRLRPLRSCANESNLSPPSPPYHLKSSTSRAPRGPRPCDGKVCARCN